MTKEQFLQSVEFKTSSRTYKGAPTFSYNENGYLSEQLRSSSDERCIVNQFCCNIIKVGSKGFSAFTFVMDKRVVVKYKFEELVVFNGGEI